MSTHSNRPDATERNELELIARVRAGGNECFHELIRPYERAMYSIAYSILRNAEDAEDVAQEAAFKAFQHLGQLQEDDKFKSWLLRIANNEARMRRRKDRPHLYESIDSSDQEEENGDFRPHSFADWKSVLTFITEYGYGLIFLWVLVEQLGVPVPSFPVLLAVGSLAALDRVSLPLATASAFSAALISDIAWFHLGRRHGMGENQGRQLRRRPQAIILES